MPNVHTTLTSLFSAIANAIRGKTGSSAQIVADDFPDAIDAIPTGTPLPALTDPASASDILDGKEAIDGQGQVLTGTLVPPTDTGANGLYKSMLENNVTEIADSGLTRLRTNCQRENTSLISINLPNVVDLASAAFYDCSNITGIITLGFSLSGGQYAFYRGLSRTVKFKDIPTSNYAFGNAKAKHLWVTHQPQIPSRAYLFSESSFKTIQFDNLSYFNILQNIFNTNTTAIIINTDSLCSLSGTGGGGKFEIGGSGKFYVPNNLLSNYSVATNWTAWYNAGQVIGYDRGACAVGSTFTPTSSAVGIDHWDVVDLQSYTTYSAFDSTTGAVTTNHDGRLLIRGLDSSDNILHVTYLQIGTGFDESQNLLENL